MKNKILIVGITLTLLVVGLSGCTEENAVDNSADFDKLVGTWMATYHPVMEITFASNGSYHSSVAGWANYTWELKNGQIFYTYADGSTGGQDYLFSDDYNTLTLYVGSGELVYTKKQHGNIGL